MKGQSELRVHDLVAKAARVTLKDTVRVMQSLQLVSNFLGCSLHQLVAMTHDPGRASVTQSGACEQAFIALQDFLDRNGRGEELRRLRKPDHDVSSSLGLEILR